MKVSLIFVPNELNPNFRELAVREKNLGNIPPMSLMTVAAILEKEGVKVQLLDMVAENISYDMALKKIANFSPDIIGFTLTTYSFHPVLRWIEKFKEDTGLPIIAGGAHSAIYPEETMTHPAIDYLVIGEAEIPLPEFVRAFQKNNRKFDHIKSFAYRENGRVIMDKTRQAVKDIDSIPFPARHLIRNELYASILSQKKNYSVMLSSRGCPYRCAFCDQGNPPYRTRSPQSFVEEIRYIYQEFGVREFDIWDSTFTADKKRVVDICKLINQEKIDVRFHVRSRVDSVNEHVLDALKSAGCKTILYGVESSNPEILKRMRKGISPEVVRKIISYTKQIGIQTFGYFLLGFPGETRHTIEDTIRFSLELPLDYAQFTVLIPFPETEIYRYYMQNGLGDYWSSYTLDPGVQQDIELLGTELNREETARYLSSAYRKFYFRPGIILNRALKVRSLDEFIWLFKSASGVLLESLNSSKPQRSTQSEIKRRRT